MLASVFIVESELLLLLSLVAAGSVPPERLRVLVAPLLSVVLGEPIEGLGDGDSLVLGDAVVPALLGGVVVVESGGIVVAFDDD